MIGRVDKISGSVRAGRWSQVHEFEKNGLRLVAAVSFAGEDLDEPQTISTGREILARIHELIFANPSKDLLETVKACLKVLQTEFADLNISLALMHAGVVYVGTNLAGVWVKRAGGDGFVITPNQSTTASSRIQLGDVIILANPDFFSALPEGTLRAAIATVGGMEQLVTMAHSSAHTLNPVAAVLTFFPEPVESTVVPKGPNFLQKFFRNTIYLSSESRETRQKRTKWFGVGFLILMLLLVVGYQVYKSQTDTHRIEARTKLEEITQKFTEAKALVPLNRPRSQQLLAEVAQELDSLSTNKYALNDPRYTQTKAGLESVKDEAAGVNRVSPTPVIDLTLVRDASAVSQLLYMDKQLFVLDTTNNRAFSVDLDKKSATVIAGVADLGTTKLLASYPGKVEVLSSKGIVECSLTNTTCATKVNLDTSWGVISGMGMFGGNIYLLSDTTIWRHQVSETGFTEKQDWLASSEDKSILATRRSMAIDGFIWLAGEGKIDKYTRGVHENFVVSGLDTPLGQDLAIYTDGDANNLYVLDRANSRIVSFDKTTGQYQKQYVHDDLKTISAFAADEKGGQIYWGIGGKIVAVSL